MINGVTLIKGEQEVHSYDDLGLYMKSCVIDAPTPQTHRIEVQGRNGSIDLTDVLTGNVRYNDRAISLSFRYLGAENTRTALLSNLENFAHGQKLKFIFDDDKAFYYLGRIESISPSVNRKALDIDMTLTVDPYKYNIMSSADAWLWDPFDFEEGIINETANMEVDGELEYTLIAQDRWENPIIISDSAMTVDFNGETYPIQVGSQVMYEIIITSGENVFTFHGNGTVTINYVGGML